MGPLESPCGSDQYELHGLCCDFCPAGECQDAPQASAARPWIRAVGVLGGWASPWQVPTPPPLAQHPLLAPGVQRAPVLPSRWARRIHHAWRTGVGCGLGQGVLTNTPAGAQPLRALVQTPEARKPPWQLHQAPPFVKKPELAHKAAGATGPEGMLGPPSIHGPRGPSPQAPGPSGKLVRPAAPTPAPPCPHSDRCVHVAWAPALQGLLFDGPAPQLHRPLCPCPPHAAPFSQEPEASRGSQLRPCSLTPTPGPFTPADTAHTCTNTPAHAPAHLSVHALAHTTFRSEQM